ncbi:hypothetical protein BDV25DRAFT_26728 [Aspergillus avenaceus]|uniref:Transmembrane protein n=1 Tax=Aspergillus avenaceus TaxID=36643 RepID=A0A5N6TNE1_ASPAV|nr:hypothetical protein BDV25DRAFT_26728 [Aspergillus avenaceus]
MEGMVEEFVAIGLFKYSSVGCMCFPLACLCKCTKEVNWNGQRVLGAFVVCTVFVSWSYWWVF